MTSQEQTSSQQANDASKTTGGPGSSTISRLIVGTACDVFGGVAHASAEAFQSVNAHFKEPQPNLVAGLLRGNARFLEEMSHTVESVAKRFQTQSTSAPGSAGSSDTEG